MVMSGLVGFLNLENGPVDEGWLVAATGYQAFRGPDAQAVWNAGPVGLGHALLRTTAESAHERQPFSLDGQVWIAADARLDGRGELLAMLHAARREISSTEPDVVLILHAYALWEEGCLDHLHGDFAFLLWDGRKQRLLCARDRFGVKPLYYARSGVALLVSNTLNALRLHPQVPITLDEEAIGHYLLFGMRPAQSDATTFAAIRRLRPAHLLTADRSGMRVRRYWEAPSAPTALRRVCRSADLVAEFSAIFDQAVGDRLRTDHIGTALSGGMDSASIAVTAHTLLTATHRPFVLRGATIAYDRLIPDEEDKYARQVSEHCGFPTDVFIAEHYIEREPTWAPSYPPPEPWAILGLTAEEEINRQASAYTRVYLMGFGGDPLFSPTRVGWKVALRHAQWRTFLSDARRQTRKVRRWWRGDANLPFPTWLAPDFAHRNQLGARWVTEAAAWAKHDQHRGMAHDALWENIFMVADPGFTGMPVMPRFPFFDARLINFMRDVPPDPWCRGKYLLREAMRDRLPRTVLERPKTILQGFPHLRWLQEKGFSPWMQELTDLPELAEFVDRQAVLALLASPETLNPASLGQVFKVLGFAYWLKFHTLFLTPTPMRSINVTIAPADKLR